MYLHYFGMALCLPFCVSSLLCCWHCDYHNVFLFINTVTVLNTVTIFIIINIIIHNIIIFITSPSFSSSPSLVPSSPQTRIILNHRQLPSSYPYSPSSPEPPHSSSPKLKPNHTFKKRFPVQKIRPLSALSRCSFVSSQHQSRN